MKLRRDIYPAQVLLPDGTLHRKARVFITADRLVIWTANPGREIVEQEFSIPYDSVQRKRDTMPLGERLEIPLTSATEGGGGVAHVQREQGCGCGSLLKRAKSPHTWN